jgi:hypothetical protein
VENSTNMRLKAACRKENIEKKMGGLRKLK